MNRDAQKFFTLRFADSDSARNPCRGFGDRRNLSRQRKRRKPLSGLKIALDPGHLGGKWAKMEERWFQVGDSQPVQEGDLTLRVARLLATRLRDLGAKVSFVEVPTSRLPASARMILVSWPGKFSSRMACRSRAPTFWIRLIRRKEHTIRWQSEILFYRYSEIRRRAALVNFKLHPDLVLCLHFNAEGWGDPTSPTVDRHESSSPARERIVSGGGTGIR